MREARSQKECISEQTGKARKRVAGANDEQVRLWMHNNNEAVVVRLRQKREFPRNRSWRRLLLQEMHKRGLGT